MKYKLYQEKTKPTIHSKLQQQQKRITNKLLTNLTANYTNSAK